MTIRDGLLESMRRSILDQQISPGILWDYSRMIVGWVVQSKVALMDSVHTESNRPLLDSMWKLLADASP
mgnify:CR=1 FL=1